MNASQDVRPRRRGRPPTAGAKAVRGRVQSLTRGLHLLERLAQADGGVSLTDLAQQVGLAASTAHRLLSTLQQAGFVSQNEQLGLWFVGVKAFSVGNAFLDDRDFVAASRPVMRALMEASGESANLAMLDAGEMVFLSQVECHEMMRMQVKLGGRAPVHASAVGKAVLAALPDTEITRILHRRGLSRFTASTLVTPAALRDDLATVRRTGYAVDNEEHAIGLRCVAATLHDELGEPVAALSLSGPRARIPEERIGVLGALVVDAANEVTAGLGGRTPQWRAHQAA